VPTTAQHYWAALHLIMQSLVPITWWIFLSIKSSFLFGKFMDEFIFCSENLLTNFSIFSGNFQQFFDILKSKN
jgi:hypothetical protein